jgi:hypothetical protein
VDALIRHQTLIVLAAGCHQHSFSLDPKCTNTLVDFSTVLRARRVESSKIVDFVLDVNPIDLGSRKKETRQQQLVLANNSSQKKIKDASLEFKKENFPIHI